MATAARWMISAISGHSLVRAFLLCLAVSVCAGGQLAVATAAHAHAGNGPTNAVSGLAAAAEPLTDADRDLVVKVRLAGLWELPAGRMAADKGVNPRVREIGAMIASQHKQLDDLVIKAAAKLGVPLPTEPNADQTSWLGEMTAASGPQFDQVFVSRLRAAHGKIFPAIANVRSGTRNSVVRDLAQSANGFVLMHLTLLESTGLVKYSTLPQPPAPSAAAGAAQVSPVGAVTSAADSPFWFLWVVVPVALVMVGWRVLRSAPWRRDDDRDDAPPRPSSRASGRDRRVPSRRPVPAGAWSDDWPPPRPPVTAGSTPDRFRPPPALPSPYGYGGEPAPRNGDRRPGPSPRYRP